MQNCLHTLERSAQLLLVRNIADNEFETMSEKAMAGRKVVVDDRPVTMPPQSPRCVTADVTCPPNDEYIHQFAPSPKCSCAMSTIARPIGMEAVAAGDGTLPTCSILPAQVN